MYPKFYRNFETAFNQAAKYLLDRGSLVHTESWQGKETNDKQGFLELLNISFSIPMTWDRDELIQEIQPNLPWADVHFDERVGGKPLNPGESYKLWPYYKNIEAAGHRSEGSERFTHTYMERFWPKFATDEANGNVDVTWTNKGIRFPYGDVMDVVNLLERERGTRQAYLPIWFPEDTGAVHGGRVPCTLGYHFIIRENVLYLVYYMRACDLVRHFRDDVYLAQRLARLILIHLTRKPDSQALTLGALTMHVTSLHCFESDRKLIERWIE